MGKLALTAFFISIHVWGFAQQPATKPNIPLAAILNMAYRDAPVQVNQAFFARGNELYLLDLKPGAKDSITLRELKGDYRLGDTARKYGPIYLLDLTLLHIEPGKLHLRLSLTSYDGKSYIEQKPLGTFYDARDIECEYDFFAKQWKYLKTIKVWDY